MRHLVPDFFVIGNTKCATTWLNKALANHPDILISRPKECNVLYDALDGRKPEVEGVPVSSPDPKRVSNLDTEWQSAYENHYGHYSSESMIGDGSLKYIYPHILKHIREHMPNARHIFLMRDPIERVMSMRLHRLRMGSQRVNIDAAINAYLSGRTDFNVLDQGMYHRRLELLLKYFPREQIFVLVTERMLADKSATLKQIFDFLGVNSDIEIDLPDGVVNSAKIPRSYLLAKLVRHVHQSNIMKLPLTKNVRLHRLVHYVRRKNLIVPPPDVKKFTDKQVERLANLYIPEVERLEVLLEDRFFEWETIKAYRE